MLDVVRSAVKIADGVTKPLQSTVVYERYLSEDSYGNSTFDNPVFMRAIVDFKQSQVRTQSGIVTVARATITFLSINALTIATAGDGIDWKDRITLQDGTTGPILNLGGFVDAGTGNPVATEVYIG